MLISASFQSHRLSQRGHTHTHHAPALRDCMRHKHLNIHYTPPPPLSCKSLETNIKRYLSIYGLHRSSRMEQQSHSREKGWEGDASMNIEWRHLLPQWSGQAGLSSARVTSDHSTSAQNSDKFNSNPSLKCSQAQTGGEKSASAAFTANR